MKRTSNNGDKHRKKNIENTERKTWINRDKQGERHIDRQKKRAEETWINRDKQGKRHIDRQKKREREPIFLDVQFRRDGETQHSNYRARFLQPPQWAE